MDVAAFKLFLHKFVGGKELVDRVTGGSGDGWIG
jgi:hypothetical protein